MPHDYSPGRHTAGGRRRTFEHKLAGGNHRKQGGCCEFGVAVRAVALMTLAAAATVVGVATALVSTIVVVAQ